MKKYFLLLCISFYLGQINSYGQDLKVGKNTYLINSKKQVNSDVEYLKLKEKSVKNAKAESFIRVNKVVSKTVFSEAEIKKLLTNGSISSLGRVIEKKIKIQGKILNLKYIKKGDVQVLFHIEKDKLQLREYYTDLADRFEVSTNRKKKPKFRTDIGYVNCQHFCQDEWASCISDSETCDWLFNMCVDSCEDVSVDWQGPAGKPRPPVTYYIPIKNVTKKIK